MTTTFGTRVLDWKIISGTLAILLLMRLLLRTRRIPKGLRLPPGPPGKVIFGNASDYPTHHEWETFTQWAKTYGDLVYIKVLNMDIVFANTEDIAHELFETRSSIYSDRFDFPMLNDLMGFNWNFALMHYGERWRRHRKAFDQKFRLGATGAYHEVQATQTRNLIRRLYESPKDFVKHLRHLSGAIIMEVTYGIRVLPLDDPYIETAERAMTALAEAGNPGAFAVDTFPILKYLPAWMPGAGFRRKALAWRVPVTAMVVAPFEAVKKRMNAGTAEPSILASLLSDLSSNSDSHSEEEETIRNTVGAAYLGGSDTTASALTTFVLAMVLHSEVQRKAQDEVDIVIGMKTHPVIADRERLPYVDALCKEVLRWHPVVPLAIAHCVTRDDVYGDFFIPKGSVVVGNAWAILHDEKIFGPEPEKFDPERFLRPGVKFPTQAFGFGRRICPGRYLAENSVFIAIVSMLQAFDITHAKDSNGVKIPVKGTFTSGAISYPEPFQCDIKLRQGFSESSVLIEAGGEI